jgi:hypothetical protein
MAYGVKIVVPTLYTIDCPVSTKISETDGSTGSTSDERRRHSHKLVLTRASREGKGKGKVAIIEAGLCHGLQEGTNQT